MRTFVLLSLLLASSAFAEGKSERLANTVVLDAAGVKNLGIETIEAEETRFEETVFALGRVEVLPGKRAVVSSRIPGRAFSVLALPDQTVDEGEELMWVESRQPGDPPPTVMLPAPMAGIIAKVDIAVGQPITPDQSLIEIVDLSIVEASARVPEHLAAKLTKGQKAHIRLPGFPGEVFEAELNHLGAYADGESGTVEAAFHVPNKDLRLRPQMRAEFNIVVGSRDDVMSVPRAALQGDVSGRFVYVKDYDLEHAFVKVPVTTGAENHEFVEIVKGLLPGDEVVTKGAYSLVFAGKGSVSLKEALDAAHGHAHNEDGTEMTKEQLAAHGDHHDHDHDHEESPWNNLTWFFAASTGLLLMLLILGAVMKRKPAIA
ncbi:MAG: efflux RND transporter periplasmic adaptor subunit [Verrucomicrobiaceae bacterium]|nr:efflux RND transporter periplasmic adaptor subunit [Verrucomicrobiaceae bacterium]